MLVHTLIDSLIKELTTLTIYLLVKYLPYYICDYYVTYTTYAPGNVPTGDCGTADLYVDSIVESEVQTHEFRVNAPLSDTMSSDSWGIHE